MKKAQRHPKCGYEELRIHKSAVKRWSKNLTQSGQTWLVNDQSLNWVIMVPLTKQEVEKA